MISGPVEITTVRGSDQSDSMLVSTVHLALALTAYVPGEDHNFDTLVEGDQE